MAWYDIDYKRMASELTPIIMRKTKVISFFVWLMSGVESVYNKWKSNRLLNIKRANTTSQVYSLEKFLNDKYDKDDRRIKVLDGSKHDPTYLFLERENNPVYFYLESENKPIYMYLESEVGDNNLSFIVQVPRGIYSKKEQIITDVNFYKDASKTFIIDQI